MLNLKGKHIFLRALEATDLDFLYNLENDTDVWEISGTTTPYSKHVLQLYLDSAHRDIYDVKQLRLCICDDSGVMGLIDLFDFDPKNNRAGIGIVIASADYRNKGVGAEAITILCDYAFSKLNLKQLYANVGESNAASLHLFKKLGFSQVGIKKDWIYADGVYKNEVMLQKIKEI